MRAVAATRLAAPLFLVLGLALPGTLAAAPPKAEAEARPAQTVPDLLLKGLAWREAGPYRGGRVVAVAGVAGQPLVFYFGATGGGIWKTTDAGARWSPIADGQIGTGDVGALAVAPSDPNVIYAGMGEGCIRGNVSHGDGVYRSTDGGRTWSNVGLKETKQIGRVRVHPKDADLVYVAALGHAFGPNAERGVFRSKDGGAHWQKVLFVDDRTGAIDLALDPTNPRVLYAATWQVVRTPWSLESGGPGSGLYKSTDGGDTWRRLTEGGLPKGPWGRVGVTVSPANPSRLWAVIEADEGGVYRSEDAGKTWKRTNSDRRLRQRAWYYTHVFADPQGADTVYVLNVGLFRSKDGGATFEQIRAPHGDNHDLWIAPEDPRRMIDGNDGGATVSLDGGKSWSSLDTQPTAQIYHVTADDRVPYFVYGAQQDNTTVALPSASVEGGIDRSVWYPVGGCESGYVAPKPDDPQVVFAGCYGGQVTRYDRRTGEERDVTVWPENPMGGGASGMRYRFQWTFPIVFSPHDPNLLYATGDRVFRTTNQGQSWTAISPDLTRHDPAKLGPSGGPITKDNTSIEYYATVFAFAESPKAKGVLWAGSDDGLVHVSKDGGATWTNVTPREMPEWSLVSQIDPSPHDPATAYLATTRYKLDDFRPYAWVTNDYGKTWRKITAGLPDDTFVRVVREDPVRRGLLYAGTETGAFVSFDDGAHWQPLRMAHRAPPADTAAPESTTPADEPPAVTGALPVVPVTDLIVKGRDLVASTQGRGFWILDEVTPLREMAASVAGEDVHLFPPAPASRLAYPPARPGTGQNPPGGAVFYYWLKAVPKDAKEAPEAVLEIADAAGAVVRRISSKPQPLEETGGEEGEGFGGPRGAARLPVETGLNRYAWDLRATDASRFKGLIMWAGNTRGPRVPPGTYQARLTVAGHTVTAPFTVTGDPRLATTADEYAKQYALARDIRDLLTQTNDAVTRIRAVREQVKAAAERAKAAGDDGTVGKAAEALAKSLTAVEEELYQTKNQSSQDPLNFPIRLNNKLAALGGVVASADAPPTDQDLAVFQDLKGRIDAQLQALGRILDTDLAAFNRLTRDRAVPAAVVTPPESRSR